MSRAVWTCAAAALALNVLAGCSPNGSPEGAAVARTASLPASAPPVARPATVYRVAAGDVLEVRVFGQAELSGAVEVDGQGQIMLPLIGRTPAIGKSVRDLEAEIARRLGERYLQNPQVTVFVRDAVGQRVTLDGAVRRPGTIQVKGAMTLQSALAEAGGFADTADLGAVMIFRNTEQGRMAARFDANAIRSGQMPDPPIYGGDTIVVDESAGKLAWKQLREALPVAGFFRPF